MDPQFHLQVVLYSMCVLLQMIVMCRSESHRSNWADPAVYLYREVGPAAYPREVGPAVYLYREVDPVVYLYREAVAAVAISRLVDPAAYPKGVEAEAAAVTW